MGLRRVERSRSRQRTGSIGYRTYVRSVSIFACPKPRKVRRLNDIMGRASLIGFPGARLYVPQRNRIFRISM